jgi:phosphoglycerate dehydrogenase-like enzyme
MAATNIVVTFKARPEQRAFLTEALADAAEVTFLQDVPDPEREEVLGNAEVLLSWNIAREIAPLGAAVLRRTALLQLVSAGADHVPFADLPPQVAVAANTGAFAEPMAEHVMALSLALAKRLCVQNEKLRRGEFDQLSPNRRLSGMTAGILGYGAIGQAAAHLMRAFGMRIYAINTTGQSPEPADFIGTLTGLEHVLRESDLVLISLPLTKATRGLIRKEQLGWMKPESILINVARAAVIDEEDLYLHARSHPGFLLGIDAWWTEPFGQGEFRMEHPFLELPSVLGSPHNSAVTADSLRAAALKAVENIRRHLKGQPVSGIVRREDYL